MILFQKISKKSWQDARGFTFVELMLIVAILSILSSIAFSNYMPIRAKALDAAAVSDARNLVDSIVNAAMIKEDVDYTKPNFSSGAGGAVGDLDTTGNARTPIFVLSPGVEARIGGGSDQGANLNATIVNVTLYHTGGTVDGTFSGRKEFTCTVNEETGVISTP